MTVILQKPSLEQMFKSSEELVEVVYRALPSQYHSAVDRKLFPSGGERTECGSISMNDTLMHLVCKRIQDAVYCGRLEQIHIYSQRGRNPNSIPAWKSETRSDTANLSWQLCWTDGREEGKRSWWMTLGVWPPAIANTLQSSICHLGGMNEVNVPVLFE